MKTFRFRDFQVFRDAVAFRKRVTSTIQTFPSSERFRLTDQIHRSCISIVLNIAEGSAKQSDADFARFLEMAVASVNEVVAAFDMAIDDQLLTEEVRQSIESEAEQLAKQLGGFLKKLRSVKS